MPTATPASVPSAATSAAPPPQIARATPANDAKPVTPSGTTFTVPAGWTLKSDGARRLLEGPEPDLRLAIVENDEATADAAVTSAWAARNPSFKRPLQLATDMPARFGWEQQRKYTYEVSPNEKRVVAAIARRSLKTWTVILIDVNESAFGRRAADLRILAESLRPRGYQRESFKGRTAHVLDRERIAVLSKFIEFARAEAGVPGIAIGLVQGGKVVFEGGFGVRALGKSAPVDAETLFLVASNTKALTTLLLAKEIDEGKFTWDTPVSSVYPAFELGDPQTSRLVQIKHLVCACTGLPRQDLEWLYEFAKKTPADEMKWLATTKPTTQFGETYQYSNLLAAAAGFVGGYAAYPKRELGAAYDEAMRTRVFEPLGMRATTFDFDRAERVNHATPHSEDVDGTVRTATNAVNRAVMPLRPAAGAWSSAHDLTRYVQMELANGALPDGRRYVSEQNLLARRKPQVTSGQDATYGMGLEVDEEYGTPLIHHGGGMLGFKSDMFWFPEYGVGAVILTNANSGNGVHVAFARKVLEVLFDGHAEADEDLSAFAKERKDAMAKDRARLTMPAAPQAVAALAKHYANPALGELTVVHKGRTTVFDFGEWQSAIASRTNDDGTTSFVLVEPSAPTYVLVAAERDGKGALLLRDRQHEYVFLAK